MVPTGSTFEDPKGERFDSILMWQVLRVRVTRVRAVTGVTRLRAAGVTGFDAVLEPLKAASKPSEFGCSNTKTPIIASNNFGSRLYGTLVFL